MDKGTGQADTGGEHAVADGTGESRSLEQLEAIKRSLLANGTQATDPGLAKVDLAMQGKRAVQMSARPMASQLGRLEQLVQSARRSVEAAQHRFEKAQKHAELAKAALHEVAARWKEALDNLTSTLDDREQWYLQAGGGAAR